MATPVKLDLDRLEAIRDEHGFESYAAMARHIGIDPVTMNQIRNGTRGISALIITRMFTELRVPFDPGEPGSLYLFTDAELDFRDSFI